MPGSSQWKFSFIVVYVKPEIINYSDFFLNGCYKSCKFLFWKQAIINAASISWRIIFPCHCLNVFPVKVYMWIFLWLNAHEFWYLSYQYLKNINISKEFWNLSYILSLLSSLNISNFHISKKKKFYLAL
jgi:hypothetical protein